MFSLEDLGNAIRRYGNVGLVFPQTVKHKNLFGEYNHVAFPDLATADGSVFTANATALVKTNTSGSTVYSQAPTDYDAGASYFSGVYLDTVQNRIYSVVKTSGASFRLGYSLLGANTITNVSSLTALTGPPPSSVCFLTRATPGSGDFTVYFWQYGNQVFKKTAVTSAGSWTTTATTITLGGLNVQTNYSRVVDSSGVPNCFYVSADEKIVAYIGNFITSSGYYLAVYRGGNSAMIPLRAINGGATYIDSNVPIPVQFVCANDLVMLSKPSQGVMMGFGTRVLKRKSWDLFLSQVADHLGLPR